MDVERQLGFDPTDREFEKLGYDIESRIAGTGKLRFIEVKGRVSGAPTITVTRNEILYSLNKPDDFILAIVGSSITRHTRFITSVGPSIEGRFWVTSVNYVRRTACRGKRLRDSGPILFRRLLLTAR